MWSPDKVPSAVVYQRAAGLVFRWMRGSVLVGGPGRRTQRLEGAAALVWLVVERPTPVADLHGRIHRTWPDLGGADATEISSALVADAVALLVAGGMITESRPENDRNSNETLGTI